MVGLDGRGDYKGFDDILMYPRSSSGGELRSEVSVSSFAFFSVNPIISPSANGQKWPPTSIVNSRYVK